MPDSDQAGDTGRTKAQDDRTTLLRSGSHRANTARGSSWEAADVAQAQARLPERQRQFITASGRPVERLYTPADIAGLDYDRDLGLPGRYPYTRGVQPTGYRGKLWTMRMFAGFGTRRGDQRRASSTC